MRSGAANEDASEADTPQTHRGVRSVAVIELAKGLLAAATAIALFVAGPQPIHDMLAQIGAAMRFDPNHGALSRFLHGITPDRLHIAATAIAVYAAMRFILSWGLWHTRAWASWLGAATVGLYLPFTVFAVWRNPGWPAYATLGVNVTILAILVRDLVLRSRARHDRAIVGQH